MAQTAAQRAVDVFVSAVKARGGKAEVTTKGILTLVTVTAGDRTTTLRVKGTNDEAWTARKTEATVAKAPVTAWALVDLSDGAPIALVSAADYAAHVKKLVVAWEAKHPGKPLTAATTLPVTADAVAGWEDAWDLVGLGGVGAKASKVVSDAEHAVVDKTAKVASKAAGKVAEKTVEKAGEKATEKTAAKRAAVKTAVKTPAKKVAAAKKAAPAKKAPAKKAPAKAAATKAPAKTAAKAPAKKAPVKASEAKITPIAAQKEAAAQSKVSAAVAAKAAKTAPKTDAKDAKPAATKAPAKAAKATKPADAKTAPKSEAKGDAKAPAKAKKKGLLQRIPVVGQFL